MILNQVVVVTGGGSGIGKTVAQSYASLGHCVVIAEKQGNKGLEVAEQINEKGGKALFVKVDVRDPLQIKKLFRQVADLSGSLKVLINNAGITRNLSLYQLSTEDWDEVLETNLRGAFLCSREAALMMRANGGGFIINIASTRAMMSEPYSEAYAASKGGILSLTHALAASLSKDNIRVNAISPGWIETVDYTSLSQRDHLQHFSGRVGKPEDIARACLFLSNPENDFITGINLVVDGGMTRKMIYEP